MGTLGELMMIGGPLALVAGIASAIYYFIKRHRSRSVTLREAFLYAIGVLILTPGTWAIGAIFGISAACSSSTSGNLCGLIGIFGIGPLFAAVALFCFSKWWATRAAQAL